jgi:formylglycine-generating enzyme required for sulfatase activity
VRVALSIVALAILSPLLMAQRSAQHVARPNADRVHVPRGAFFMGTDSGGEEDEQPRHRVTVAPFDNHRLEVTRAQYQLCVDAGVCSRPRGFGARFERAEQPIVGVSWDDARAYCGWLSARLPTEEEWERAARGDDERTYAWGNEPPTPERAVFGLPQSTGAPDTVGSHPLGAGPYGALDLTGNVWEWTATPYDPYAYRHATAATCESALASLADLRARSIQGFTGRNPLPDSCERVLRGGAWNYGAAGLRVTNRVHHPPRFRIVVAGFRCAR